MNTPLFRLFFIGILLFVTGCATTSTRKTEARKPCGFFCEEISKCARKEGYEKYEGLLCDIAKCETGNKCRTKIASPSGRYQGPFQFSKKTWRSQCYPVFRKKNLQSCRTDKAMQDTCCSTVCAAELIDNDGIGNWPTCGKAKSTE